MGRNIGVVLSLRDKFTPDIKKVAQNVGKTEREIKKARMEIIRFQNGLQNAARNATVGFGIAITAAAAGTAGLIQKTMQAGDRVDKMSQKIGMSRKSFQEYDYILSQNGGSVDNLQIGMKTLAKQMEGVQAGSKKSVSAFKTLGVSVKNSNGTLRTQQEVFDDSIKSLQNIKNPAQKAILANQLFGRSAIEMMPLLNQSAQSTDKLRQKAHELGLVMSDDSVNSAVLFTDTMDTIGRSLSGIGYQIGAEMLPSLQDISNVIIAHMPQIKDVAVNTVKALGNGIKFLADNMNWLFPIAGAVLSTMLAYKTISTVTGVISTLQGIIKSVTVVQGIWNAVMLANPIGILALGIGSLIGVISLLVVNWEKVTASASKAWKMIKKIAGLGGINPKEVSVNTSNSFRKPHHATGTSYARGGIARVGERGPEDVILPSGSKVVPNNKIAKSGDINVNLTIQGNLIGTKEFIDYMCNMIAQSLSNKMAASL